MHIIVKEWPNSIDEFKELDIFDLENPHNTVTLFLIALDLFVKNEEEGIEAINILLGPVDLNPHNISFLRDRLLDKTYLPKAYFDGAKPENNYEAEIPYTLNLYPDQRPQDLEEGYMKVYVQTKGADSKRFVTLRQKDEKWFVWEYPGILMDIRKPKKEDPWG